MKFTFALGSWALLGLTARLLRSTLAGNDIVSSKRVFSRKREALMEGTSLLSLPEGMRVEHIQITEHGLVIEVVTVHPTSCCPLCAETSDSIQSHYRRVLRDAPCAGRQVQLVLTVRKFYCRNPYCSRKVFTERLPTFVEPWARMTIRCCQQITSIGLATCGKGGARLAGRLGIQTTRPTILRRIMDLPDVSAGSVVYLGIDDFAFRRGYRFGTILVNLESHRVVDLLPDRQAETAAQWMRQQPDLAVGSRDRGGEYASAASKGAPQAIQCADRFHIIKKFDGSRSGASGALSGGDPDFFANRSIPTRSPVSSSHCHRRMASSRAGSCREGAFGAAGRPLCALSASCGTRQAGSSDKRDCRAAGDE